MSTTTAKAIGTFHPILIDYASPINIDRRQAFSVATKIPTAFGFEGVSVEGYQYVADTKYWRFEPAEEAPAVWDGEGLPPVGAVCEYSLTNGGVWHECTIKYVLANGKQLVAECSGNPTDEESVLHVNTCQFRTTRTPEQIEAEEREKAAIDLAFVMTGHLDRSKDCYKSLGEIIYDAGYRKQVAP